MIKCKFKVGDRVRIVGCGHQIWMRDGDWMTPGYDASKHPIVVKDLNPGIVGKIGIVSQNGEHYKPDVGANYEYLRKQYALSGIPEKSAWYHEEQLELVSPSP